MDQVYNAFDQLCDQFGLQKIETVGKTYMACGGLKSAEKKIDARLLNRHHSVRVTDFAMEIANYVKSIYLKSGRHLEVKIGIHTGLVISGVVGDTKPQFSLIGDTVNKSSRVCSHSQPLKVSVSKETHHYLELYTNNYSFQQVMVEMKGIGAEPIYSVSNLKGRTRNQADKNVIKSFDGHLQGGGEKPNKNMGNNDDQDEDKRGATEKNNNLLGLLNESESNSQSISNTGYESHKGMAVEKENYQNYDQDEQFENESNKSDQIDDGIMNVFGFNDDLNLDDRLII